MIELLNGKTVCNFCPEWAEECLNRELDAKRFIEMPRDKAKAEYRARKESGEDLTRLDAVIKRLNGS